MEHWKETRYKSYYVSNLGKIKRILNKVDGGTFERHINPFKAPSGLKFRFYTSSKTRLQVNFDTLIVETFDRKLSEDEKVIHLNGDIYDCTFENLEIVKDEKQKDLVYYIPVVEYQSKMGVTKIKPNKVVLVTNKTRIKKLESPHYQKEKADEIFDFIFNHCPHGIFQKLAQRFDKHNTFLEAYGINNFDMNKFNTKQLTIINNHTKNLLEELK